MGNRVHMKNKKFYYVLMIIITFIPDSIFTTDIKYPYCVNIDNVTVCSDINLHFSKQHANHALMTWNYF